MLLFVLALVLVAHNFASLPHRAFAEWAGGVQVLGVGVENVGIQSF